MVRARFWTVASISAHEPHIQQQLCTNHSEERRFLSVPLPLYDGCSPPRDRHHDEHHPRSPSPTSERPPPRGPHGLKRSRPRLHHDVSPVPAPSIVLPLFIHPLTACLFFKQDRSARIQNRRKLLFLYCTACRAMRFRVVHHAVRCHA